jgi:putative ABC transport system permease protein
MIRYAWHAVSQSKGRLLISIGGVALSLILIVSLDAVLTGAERRITAYIDHSGADVIVSQAGVRTMHMGASAIPAALGESVRAVPGVESVTPVLFLSDVIKANGTRSTAYIIGLPPDAATGWPWRIVEGAPVPETGGALIDRSVARRAGVGIGDQVTILGLPFRIDGISDGTATMANSVAVIATNDFARILGGGQNVSFFFVATERGRSAREVAARIEQLDAGVTVQTRAQFAEEERRLVRDMGAGLISLMNGFGLLVGLAVMALTVYTATLARRAEFGTLKAIGARNRDLYRVVLVQALISVALGLVAAVGVAQILATIVPRLSPGLALALGTGSMLKVIAAALAIAGVSALLPIRQIAGLDPAMVYRRR